jgi:hypothetical protein
MLRLVLAVVCMRTAVFAVSAAGSVAFPVHYSMDNRYLADQNGVPFPIMGRTAWFVTSISVVDYHAFVDDTAARGYNAIEMHVINHDPRGNNPPFNGNGDAPFLNRLDGSSWNGVLSGIAPDFTSPKEAYWTFVDGFLSYCESKGILVFMFPAYAGYGGGQQGWMQEMVANGPKKMQSYGSWIATRYREQKNLVWMMGGDVGTGGNPFNPAQTAVESALLAGLQSVSSQQSIFFSAEWNSESIAIDQMNFGTAMTLNGAYSFSGYVNNQGRRAYASSPVEPAFLLEEPYDEEGPDGNGVNSSATQPVRRFQWWGWLSTTAGYISGNGYVWPFRAPAWHDHLNTQGSRDMARMNAFINSIAWYKLVPSGLSGMRDLITAGGSSVILDDYVAAAATFDGILLVAYIPPDHSGPITVDMMAMSGPSQARWFDPTNGAYTKIGTGLPNTGTRVFTPPGNNSADGADWVLIIDTVVVSPTPTPAIATPTPTPTAVASSTPAPSPLPVAQALNISTRMRIQAGDNVGIGGFVLSGTAPKHVLIRALGPSLTKFGVPDALADPVLELHGPGTFVTITNDNWRDDSVQEAAILADGIPPTDNLESAIDANLNAGAYTAVVRGKNDSSGVGLVEIYDLGSTNPSRLGNISTRAFVNTGNNIVIAGFILGGGNGNDRIIVRGIGPSLEAYGVSNALANPTIEIRDGNGALFASDNNWQDDSAQAAELIAAGLTPTNNLESAIAATLPPGLYTALLAGLDDGTGVGLVEVYDRGGGP